MNNTFKLKAVVAGVSVALANTAVASNLGDELLASSGVDNLTEILIGGATAPENFLREDVVLRICDSGSAGPVQVYVDTVATTPSTTSASPILDQDTYFVVRCTAAGTGTALDGAEVAVYKVNGGSATGVAPVADATGLDFMDAGTANGECAAVTGGIGGANAWPINGSLVDTYELYECGDDEVVTQIPDAGVSDVEPAVFVGELGLGFGPEATGDGRVAFQPFVDQGNLDVKPGPGLVFGVGVSIELYDELQEDQFAAGQLDDQAACAALVGGSIVGAARALRDQEVCMPSVPKQFISTVMSGSLVDWDDITAYGNALDTSRVNAGDVVHICRRTSGSGTHAQFSIEHLGTNCTSSSQKTVPTNNDGNGGSFFGFNSLAVYANRGSSDMNDCLDALGNGLGFDGDFDGLPQSSFFNTGDSSVVPGSALPAAGVMEVGTPAVAHGFGQTYNNGGVPYTAYGMGYNSTENNTDFAFDYRFVKIDGAAPTLEDTVAGYYKDIYYLSYQSRVSGTDVATLPGGIRDTADHASEQAEVNAFFSIWNATDPAAIGAVNEGFVHDPDGIAASGDEWQGGFLSGLAGASSVYTGVAATPWARQTATGAADSCQELAGKI